jgi:hypothetical protein
MVSNQEKLNEWFKALDSKNNDTISIVFAKTQTIDSKLIIEGENRLTGVWVGWHGYIEMTTIAKAVSNNSLTISLVSCVANKSEGIAVVQLIGNRLDASLNQLVIYLYKFNEEGLIIETNLIPSVLNEYNIFFQ